MMLRRAAPPAALLALLLGALPAARGQGAPGAFDGSPPDPSFIPGDEPDDDLDPVIREELDRRRNPVARRGPDGKVYFYAAPDERDDAAATAATPQVPGAESVEPVLRCVYRPHPDRAEAVYAFLKAHAAEGVDVSLRTAPAPTDAEDEVETTAAEPRERDERRAARPVRQERPPRELVVVAPAEAQRAIGAFLSLCVSPEAPPAVRAPQDSRPSLRDSPYESPIDDGFPARDSFRPTPDAFGDDPFGDGEPDGEPDEPPAFEGFAPSAPDDDGFGGDAFDDEPFGDAFDAAPGDARPRK